MVLDMAADRTNGAALRAIRERSGLSVNDLVSLVGEEGERIHADHLRNIELGHRNASPKVTAAIARALRVPTVAILASTLSEDVA